MTTRYLPYEAVVQLNLDVGGPGAGVRDEDGLRSALGRIEQTMFEEDLYPSIWEKAAALTHAISSTQTFSDGNKRTALMATLMFLQLNGVEIRDLPEIQFDTFVRALAADVFTVDEDPGRTVQRGASWWQSAAAKPSDKIGFALLAQEAFNVGNSLYSLAMTPLVHSQIGPDSPVPLTAVFQVRWSKYDLGRDHSVTVRVEPDSAAFAFYRVKPRMAPDVLDAADYFSLPVFDFEIGTPSPTSSPLHQGAQPTIYSVDMLLYPIREGLSWVRIEIDGELFTRLPLNILISSGSLGAPDFLPPELTDN